MKKKCGKRGRKEKVIDCTCVLSLNASVAQVLQSVSLRLKCSFPPLKIILHSI